MDPWQMVALRRTQFWVPVDLLSLMNAPASWETYGISPASITTNPAASAARAGRGQDGWKKYCIALNTATGIWMTSTCWWMWQRKLKGIRFVRWEMRRHGR